MSIPPDEVRRLDLPVLFAEMGLTGTAVEVGVDQGFFAEDILYRWPGHLVLVDPWYCEYGWLMGPERLELAKKRLACFEGRITWMQKSSTLAASTFADGTLDWVYIDGDHSYTSVLSDLFAWYPKLKVGGVMSGHDHMDFANTEWPLSEEKMIPSHDVSEMMLCGVQSAVRDFRAYLQLTEPFHETTDTEWPTNYWWVKGAPSI